MVMLEQPNVTPRLVLTKRIQKRSKEFMLLMIWLDLESGLPKEFMKNKFNVNSGVKIEQSTGVYPMGYLNDEGHSRILCSIHIKR